MLLKEAIALTQCIGSEQTQLLIEGDIIVPDSKPDMRMLLRTDAAARIERGEISADRVSFSGKLVIKALYLAKGSEKPVHSLNLSAPIEDFIQIEGANRDMWADTAAEIAHIDYKMVNDRKVNYRAVVNISVGVHAKTSHDVVVSVDGLAESHLKKSRHSVCRVIATCSDVIQLRNDLPLPPGKPGIVNILQSDARISNKEVKVQNGRVAISGELLIQSLYTGDDGTIAEFAEHETPFSGFIEAPGAKEGMQADVTLAIADLSINIGKDEDGEDRVFAADAVISANLRVQSLGEVVLLEDAYHINKDLHFTRETVKFPRQICRNKNQCPIKEIIQLDDTCPEILQIYQASGNLFVESVKLFEDRMTVEGVIHADILYIARDDDTPLYNHRSAIPYKQTIEVKGAAPGMEAFIDHSIDHIGFNMLSGKEVEVRYLVCFTARVVDNRAVNVISDITFTDMDKSVLDKMASITVYVVQSDDSAWSIAKKFNTSLDDLLEINELDSPEAVAMGQKLLVLKKIAV
ncbi:MAG: DUF3794 domain-containing protein [Defluviitaleaceae bacterium]|nr:DUF3794 domain-containing protein [Defluviitaleaceae bacterium]MCL2835893.1 DUF3794 domain-containing protein [Defluviitaleaceae bacterium]